MLLSLIPALLFAIATPALAFETADTDHLEIKWVRDSAEYQALTRQTFRVAAASVRTQAKDLRRREVWGVVLDVDETMLDTSPYWLELAAYDRRFDWASWDTWCERRVAKVVPGARGFVRAVREAGGRVAFVTNRSVATREATIDNLRGRGLWGDTDRICLLTEDPDRTKRVRRTELREGRGPCGWEGEPVRVLAYLGDALHDLPEDGEDGGFDDNLGVRTFMLPNPMYGGFEHGVTRAGQR
jgi:5'-nucleotidase (lipoprotein e(P4) family)